MLPQAASCSRLVVTNVTAHGGADIRVAPLPDLCDMKAAALLTGLNRVHLRQLLHRHPDRFDPPIVQGRIRPSGKPTSQWPKRLLTAKDIQIIRSWYPVHYRVK